MKEITRRYHIIKLTLILTILSELGALKMLFAPDYAHEYITALLSWSTYIEHLLISVVMISIGALIHLARG